MELVDSVTRLCMMNLLLHGIGDENDAELPVISKDESLEDSANLPAPEVIAREIADDLEAALEQFATIAEDLKG